MVTVKEQIAVRLRELEERLGLAPGALGDPRAVEITPGTWASSCPDAEGVSMPGIGDSADAAMSDALKRATE